MTAAEPVAYLNMSNRILAGDGECILGTNDCDLGEKSILDSALNLLDLFDGLVVSQPVQEKINIGSWAELSWC